MIEEGRGGEGGGLHATLNKKSCKVSAVVKIFQRSRLALFRPLVYRASHKGLDCKDDLKLF